MKIEALGQLFFHSNEHIRWELRAGRMCVDSFLKLLCDECRLMKRVACRPQKASFVLRMLILYAPREHG